MFKKSIFVVLLSITALLTGCASVPMASIELDTQAKTFATKADKANIYVYRNESIGAAVKMDIAMDGKTIGQTAAKTYIALQVPPGNHTLLSKAENDFMLELSTDPGKNYFVWQEVKMGLLYARTKLQLVDETTGRNGVSECKLIEIAQ